MVGRIKERERLKKVVASSKSEFVAVYGRRRVGKTFLIREFFNYKFDFHLTGMANANTSQQLTNFHNAMRNQFRKSKANVPNNWIEAFNQLALQLETITGKRKKVIFLDELPWFDTARSDFMIALEHFWNSWATNRKDILLIGSGSAASWMINSLINNRGGLHNRVTERMKIHPFNLMETEQLLQARGCVFDRYQVLQLYMVFGGIPFYLDFISKGRSAAQNIEELCFRKGGVFISEFENLFSSLFKNAHRHEAIIRALSKKSKGLTRKALLKEIKLSTGGGLTRLLRELEESGFISRYTPFEKKSRETLYRLSDFFSMFYLRFMKNNTNFEKGVWANAIDSTKIRAWQGYTFEQVCLEHVIQIKNALGISGIISQASSWQSSGSGKGAQVDLVIDRRDQVVNLCEVKFSINPFKITKSYAANLRNKIGVFRSETKTRKAVYLTMITTYGLEENEYSMSIVQNDIKMDALFA